MNIIDALTWPLLIFTFVLIFRKPFRTLLERLAKLDYKRVSLSFADKMEALNSITSQEELN
ncbi:hypothetical protein [uncultured Sphaerochaeta sp.]|uniref:hypothetical protein n=1 Tax=uncultured Sphaerochaeta sp. TaxID=886478 RepID=UPI002A0A624E|nr:hypothetical protein [uncultured Sphaerochaeta sp.]